MPAHTTEEFIESAIKIHNGEYTYERTVYTGSANKVTITCPEHGDFEMRADVHRRGAKCKVCRGLEASDRRSKPEAKFIEDAKAVYGDTYIYNDIDYTGMLGEATVECRVHGRFRVRTAKHLNNGWGCPMCAAEKPGQNFLANANKVHGDTYDYSLVKYVLSGIKVEIICKAHGGWWQTPNHHLKGKGCPDCAPHGYNSTKPGTLYVLQDGNTTKIGITNNSPYDRVRNINNTGKNFAVHASFSFTDGQVARDLEIKFLKHLRSQYKQPTEKFDGYTECFYDVDVDKLLSEIQLSEVPDVSSCNS